MCIFRFADLPSHPQGASMAFIVRFQTSKLQPLRCVALAALALALPGFTPSAWAQAADAQVITITGKSRNNSASIAGFGELPLASAPFSATVINTGQLQDAGIRGLGDLTRLDAGITDAYNPPGYWSQLAVRGFTLDNRFNYRRDGLPINAETAIAQGNKQALEILKGTSGLQAGTSAPGGLMNLVVKRPQRAVRSVVLSFEEPGSVGASVDVGDREGSDGSLGWRVNASAERLQPSVRNSQGSRSLLAGAFDAQIARGSLLEAELEVSRQSQRSTPGFSLLGGRLPDAKAIDPRINLNNQDWSLPVVFDGRTASLRYTQALTDGIDFVAHAMSQQLRTDDRVAFPFGCSAEDDYTRYCKDDSFDFYDFRSEGERRHSRALDLYVSGQTQAWGLSHRFNAGLLSTAFNSRFGRQAYNYVGNGSIDGSARVPPDPSLTDENTNRDERSTELHLQDRLTITAQTQLWLGLRSTHLQRDSVRTNGSRATSYGQSFTTPWLALSQAIADDGTAYLSWGQGIESEVAPNRSRYTNAGQALPALKSQQVEAGYKYSSRALDWRVAVFDITRPEWRDIGACDVAGSCVKRADGRSRHTGAEAEAEWRSGPISLRGSVLALRAVREASDDSSLNGKRPTNVPALSLKLQGAYNVAALPGLALLGFITHEGQRRVLPDNSVATPGWTRLDLGARYTQNLGTGNGNGLGRSLVWRAGIDNITNQRAWKEAPFQYGHAYLYPLAPRVFHASAALSF
jgi:iron complex outermembrane recepter protein